MSAGSDQSIWYMQQVIAWQPRLFAFALSLTGNRNEADEVLQNANVALLEKQHAFRAGTQFGAWAMQIAYHEVQRHWAATARSRRRFDNVLLEQLAAKIGAETAEPGVELQHLRKCMSRLSEGEREMLSLRYGGDSVGDHCRQVRPHGRLDLADALPHSCEAGRLPPSRLENGPPR